MQRIRNEKIGETGNIEQFGGQRDKVQIEKRKKKRMLKIK